MTNTSNATSNRSLGFDAPTERKLRQRLEIPDPGIRVPTSDRRVKIGEGLKRSSIPVRRISAAERIQPDLLILRESNGCGDIVRLMDRGRSRDSNDGGHRRLLDNFRRRDRRSGTPGYRKYLRDLFGVRERRKRGGQHRHELRGGKDFRLRGRHRCRCGYGCPIRL